MTCPHYKTATQKTSIQRSIYKLIKHHNVTDQYIASKSVKCNQLFYLNESLYTIIFKLVVSHHLHVYFIFHGIVNSSNKEKLGRGLTNISVVTEYLNKINIYKTY